MTDKNGGGYRLSVPLTNLGVDRRGRERYLEMLRELGAKRVFFALGANCVFDGKAEEELRALRENCAYFKARGFEVGAWLWAFYLDIGDDFIHMEGPTGKIAKQTVCPTDEAYKKQLGAFIAKAAASGVDLIMFDDDLRYGFQGCGFGCVCENHRRMIEKDLACPVGKEELNKALTSGGKSDLRDAFLRANGRALEDFCAEMRAYVDKGDPAVRLGFCACITSWDIDGTTPDRLAKLLAGDTKPFYRLIGAPYWAAMRGWGNRLGDVIELERAEASRREDPGIEIFSEGDTYPRPRFATPASYLECFDTALRADGGTDGILKYMFDYTANADYEPGYYEEAKRGREYHARIDALFADKTAVGARVWDNPRKYGTYEIPARIEGKDDVQELAFSPAARFLTANSIPSVYRGSGCGGIAFGEDARTLPPEAFRKGLVLDAAAAKILTEKGVDVGISDFGAPFGVSREYDPAADEYIALTGSPEAYRLALRPGAKTVSTSEAPDGTAFPVSYTYENALGQRFFVFAFEGHLADQSWFRTYRRAEKVAAFFAACGDCVPVLCPGHPELYILAKANGTGCAIGLWNLCADPVRSPTVYLDRPASSARGVKCAAEADGRALRLSDIPAFDYVLIDVKF
ncbi:MAG: hypothetical protein IK118_07205 [Clostridia bacterium]|nr:hypothetical protein [Clostridia bacterium]